MFGSMGVVSAAFNQQLCPQRRLGGAWRRLGAAGAALVPVASASTLTRPQLSARPARRTAAAYLYAPSGVRTTSAARQTEWFDCVGCAAAGSAAYASCAARATPSASIILVCLLRFLARFFLFLFLFLFFFSFFFFCDCDTLTLNFKPDVDERMQQFSLETLASFRAAFVHSRRLTRSAGGGGRRARRRGSTASAAWRARPPAACCRRA